MVLLKLQEDLKERVRAAALAKYGVDIGRVGAEVPPRTELGDLAFPVAFELAKRIKETTGERRAPRAIAEDLKVILSQIEGVERIEIAGPGYLNVFFDRALLLGRLTGASSTPAPQDALPARKLIVEHTNINPNKAAHIGHLRNSVLGDTFVRILRANGDTVEVQNYIDNTGVQVADVLVGFLHVERMTLEDVRRVAAGGKFDYYCWDLYARVGLFYRHGDAEAKEDPERLRLRSQTLHDIEAGGNAASEMAEFVATSIVNCHLDTMARLDIGYDVLPRESEILHLRFWDHAFERLKNSGAIRLETEGRNAGCWVMPTDAHVSTAEHEADKIIVRSNGTVTYAGKDIAYQLWKLGRLGLDFFYRPFRADAARQHTVWMTSSSRADDDHEHPPFGAGDLVYNVIDSRQSYTQDVVRRGVAATAPEVGAEASVHLSYEMVALSPAACADLGIELSTEDRGRAYVEMSGRKGLGVKADDLIDRLIEGALQEVQSRHQDLAPELQLETATIIATGALRYFLLKWTRNTVIAFDFKEALSFEGETGPYCQYAAVRANSIFRKLSDAERHSATEFAASADDAKRAQITSVFAGEGGDELWSLVLLAARVDEMIAQAAAAAEPALLAKYVFQLARAFNLFYHHHRILAEEDATRRHALIVIAELTRVNLTKGLSLLGIQVPERM